MPDLTSLANEWIGISMGRSCVVHFDGTATRIEIRDKDLGITVAIDVQGNRQVSPIELLATTLDIIRKEQSR